MKIGQRWPENEMRECKVIFREPLHLIPQMNSAPFARQRLKSIDNKIDL
jgi:hypothetical protein